MKVIFNFIFLQELLKKMKTLILKVLLCPDLYLSKISQLTLIFQKKKFGQEERSFNPFWYESFPWLHYDLERCRVVCNMCFSREKKGNLALSSKKEDAFISTGCSSWNKAPEKFRKHESSHFHLEASTMSVFVKHTKTLEKCSVIFYVKKNLRIVRFF